MFFHVDNVMVLSRLVLVYPRIVTCSEIVRRFGVEEWDLVRFVHEYIAIPLDLPLCSLVGHYRAAAYPLIISTPTDRNGPLMSALAPGSRSSREADCRYFSLVFGIGSVCYYNVISLVAR